MMFANTLIMITIVLLIVIYNGGNMFVNPNPSREKECAGETTFRERT